MLARCSQVALLRGGLGLAALGATRQFVRHISAQVIRYDSHGQPLKVLRHDTIELPALTSTSVRVSMLAAPINPADLNQVEGVYPVKPPVPAVGGNEGVGVVVEVGNGVKGLECGDWVIPKTFGFGTWRSQGVAEETQLLKVPNDIPPEYAATISVNPSTAYRMLSDFVDLQPGEAVIQNGATSAVGRAVIQIAAARGLQTVNIIRDRPNLEEMKGILHSLGATHVVTEDFARTPAMRDLLKELGPKPRLALNCVGGKSSTQLLKLIAPSGTMVTYGGMSKEPVIVPTSALIFSDVRVRGFWMTKWYQTSSDQARLEMFHTLADFVRQGRLHYTFQPRKLADFADALAHAGSGEAKQLFVMEQQ